MSTTLCGPTATTAQATLAEAQQAAGDLPPCDTTDRDTATVRVVTTPTPAPTPPPTTGAPAPSGLAATGPSAVWRAFLLGLFLVAAGAVLTWTTRPRRRRYVTGGRG